MGKKKTKLTSPGDTQGSARAFRRVQVEAIRVMDLAQAYVDACRPENPVEVFEWVSDLFKGKADQVRAKYKVGMTRLGERNATLIIDAVKTIGSYDPDEIFFLFEENLYMNEAEEIYNFLKWVHSDRENRAFGHGNYEKRFKEFKKSARVAA